MGAYRFLDESNLKKVFVIYRSDVNDRLDPTYFDTVNELSIVKRTLFPVKKLSDLTNMKRGRFGHRPRNDPKFYNGKYPFIQTGDVVRASYLGESIQYSQTLNELGLRTSRLFEPNVMVITIAANIGDTAILDYPACFPDSLIAINTKNDKELNIYYLSIYFKFLKKYLNNLAPQSAQKNINYKQLAPTPIIVPPIETQEKIVDLYSQAYQTKQQKEQQAQMLLEGIDGYLLKELGITLPEQDNSLQSRMFTANFSEITGGRFDARFNLNHFKAFDRSLSNRYATKSIKDISKSVNSGATPKSGGSDYTTKELGIPFIRVTNLKNNTIDFSDCLYIKKEIHNNKLKRTQLKKGNVLLTMAGTIGLSVVVPEIGEANINQAIAKIEFLESINPYYVSEVLNSSIGKIQTDRLSRPSVQSNINFEEIKSINIPLPLTQKQTEIADHIKAIRTQAKQLKKEAKTLLENAKKEVEQLILGKI